MMLIPPQQREVDSAIWSIPFAPPDEIANPDWTAFSTKSYVNFWAPLSEVRSLEPMTATALKLFTSESSPT